MWQTRAQAPQEQVAEQNIMLNSGYSVFIKMQIWTAKNLVSIPRNAIEQPKTTSIPFDMTSKTGGLIEQPFRTSDTRHSQKTVFIKNEHIVSKKKNL